MTIKSKNNIQKSISIPSKYDSSARARIGELMLDQILKRTKAGVSTNGTAFKYVKGSPHVGHNLKESGDMLIELDVVNTTSGSITVGYANTSTLEANQAEGNQIGSYGGSANSSVAKPFIGISNDELDLILNKYDQEVSSSPTEEGITESFISSILSRQGL